MPFPQTKQPRNKRGQRSHLHPPMVLPTAAQARPPPAARASPPSPGMPRNPSYCTPWPSPRLFYLAVTEEGRGRWGRRVTYEKRGRGGWGEEEVVAVLTMALTRKPRHTPHTAHTAHTTPHHTTSALVGMVMNGSWINGYDSTDAYFSEG